MKKIFISLMCAVLILTGCNSNESTNDNSDIPNNNQQQEIKTISYEQFENEIKKIISNYEKTEVYYQMVNAIDGYKIKYNDLRLEIYKFDKNSDTYKKAEQNQKLTIEGLSEFDAIIKNGYALVIDENFPQRTEILNIFNKLK